MTTNYKSLFEVGGVIAKIYTTNRPQHQTTKYINLIRGECAEDGIYYPPQDITVYLTDESIENLIVELQKLKEIV